MMMKNLNSFFLVLFILAAVPVLAQMPEPALQPAPEQTAPDFAASAAVVELVPSAPGQEPAAAAPLIQNASDEAAGALAALSDETGPLPSLDGKLTADDCVRVALANSPKVVSARLGVQSAAVSLSNAKNVLLPTVSATADTAYNNAKTDGSSRRDHGDTSSQAGASLSITGITDIARNIKTQKLELQRAQMNLCDAQNAVVYDVKSAYYALLSAQRAVAIRTQSRDLYQEQYDRTKAFFDQGLRPKVDVTTAEVNLNNEILSLIRAKNLVKTQTAQLANAMGVKRGKPFVLNDKIEWEDFKLTFPQALTRAYENRPDVRSSKTALQISEIKLNQSKAAYWPTFTMGASFSKGGDEFRFDTDQTKLFAGVEVPIFSAFKTYNGVKQARIDLAGAQNSDRSLSNDVYLEVQSAFIKLNEAAESIPVAASTVEKAKENMDLARGRYNEGIGDIIALKDAEVSYTDAELNLLTARYDYAVALAELKKAMGTR